MLSLLLFISFFLSNITLGNNCTYSTFLENGNVLAQAASRDTNEMNQLEHYFGALSLYSSTYHNEQNIISKISLRYQIQNIFNKIETIIEHKKEQKKACNIALSPGYHFVHRSIRDILDTPIEIGALLELLHKRAFNASYLHENEIKIIAELDNKISDPYAGQIIAAHILDAINNPQGQNNKLKNRYNKVIQSIPVIHRAQKLYESCRSIASIHTSQHFLSEVIQQYCQDLWNLWYAYRYVEDMHDRYNISRNIEPLISFIEEIDERNQSHALREEWKRSMATTQNMLMHLHIPLVEQHNKKVIPHQTLERLNAIYEQPTISIEEKEHALTIAYHIINNKDHHKKSHLHNIWKKRLKEYNPDCMHFYTTQVYSVLGDRDLSQKKFNEAKTKYFQSIHHADTYLKVCNFNESKQIYKHIKKVCIKLIFILNKNSEDTSISFSEAEFLILFKSAKVTKREHLLKSTIHFIFEDYKSKHVTFFKKYKEYIKREYEKKLGNEAEL